MVEVINREIQRRTGAVDFDFLFCGVEHTVEHLGSRRPANLSTGGQYSVNQVEKVGVAGKEGAGREGAERERAGRRSTH